MKPEETAIVILAAGPSSRLGQPKQLLQFEGKSLLRRVAEAALLVSKKVVVVLGAHENLIRPEVEDLPVFILKNEDWASGMASSVRWGMAATLAQTIDLEAVILSVCDQPRLGAGIFQKLIAEKKRSKKGIVASNYGPATGVPALFSKKYFAQLLALEGNLGAKKLFLENPDDLALADFPGGEWDIDEVQDLGRLGPAI